MRTFNDFVEEKSQIIDLIEKQIIVGKGKKYGQVVFLAGGAGSGKGFARTHFMEGDKFKVRDVDEWKKSFIKLAQIKKKYKELRKLNLNNPKDALKLHKFIREKGIKEKTLDLLLSNARQGILPNLLFDITLKDKRSITEILPSLAAAGYHPKNINIVWVLTEFAVSVEQNKNPERGRVVPEDIMFLTHEGAANTMFDFIRRGTPKQVNGTVHIVLGGPKNTILYKGTDGRPIKTGKKKDTIVVKDFTYLTMKDSGRPMKKDSVLKGKAYEWILKNAPKTVLQKIRSEIGKM
jgi:hypothetical protein